MLTARASRRITRRQHSGIAKPLKCTMQRHNTTLVRCMADGLGVPQDYAQAAYWYHKAAEQGLAGAQFLLGNAYDKGEGVPQDYAQAAIWYRKAAGQGFPEAQSILGILYSEGKGVPQDFAEAYFWLDIGAANRLPTGALESAKDARNMIASHLTPADLSRVQERARKWFEDHSPEEVNAWAAR